MPALDRIAAVGDIPLRLWADDEAAADALHLLLGAVPEAAGPAVGTVHAGGRGPGLPARDADQVYEDRQVWIDDDDLTFLDGSGVVGRSGPGGAVIGGGDLGPDATAMGIRRLFLSSVGHLLGFHDRYLVHAGAVVVDGVTLLVLGASGAGKSTVALAGFERGWGVLSDDLTVLRRDEHGVHVAGVPRPPTIPTDLGASLPTEARPVDGDPRRRAQLPADVLTAGFRAVDGVLVVAHGTEPLAALTEVPGREVHLLLVGSFPPNSHPAQLRRSHPVFAAVSRLPAQRLEHGTDAGRRLASTASAIERFSRDLAPTR